MKSKRGVSKIKFDLGYLKCGNVYFYRHSNAIVHGDIKPSNCFLSHDARICIGDFGSARIVEEGEPLVGTIHL